MLQNTVSLHRPRSLARTGYQLLHVIQYSNQYMDRCHTITHYQWSQLSHDDAMKLLAGLHSIHSSAMCRSSMPHWPTALPPKQWHTVLVKTHKAMAAALHSMIERLDNHQPCWQYVAHILFDHMIASLRLQQAKAIYMHQQQLTEAY